MDTRHLDVFEYLGRHLSEDSLRRSAAAAGSVGHVHLQVGQIDRARDFYVNGLGFEVTNSAFPGALFASAGGYHHHVAMNTWRSQGAGPRAASLGLGSVRTLMP